MSEVKTLYFASAYPSSLRVVKDTEQVEFRDESYGCGWYTVRGRHPSLFFPLNKMETMDKRYNAGSCWAVYSFDPEKFEILYKQLVKEACEFVINKSQSAIDNARQIMNDEGIKYE